MLLLPKQKIIKRKCYTKFQSKTNNSYTINLLVNSKLFKTCMSNTCHVVRIKSRFEEDVKGFDGKIFDETFLFDVIEFNCSTNSNGEMWLAEEYRTTCDVIWNCLTVNHHSRSVQRVNTLTLENKFLSNPSTCINAVEGTKGESQINMKGKKVKTNEKF